MRNCCNIFRDPSTPLLAHCPLMHPRETAGHTDYAGLAERMGREVLKRRILKQAGIWVRTVHQGRGIFRMERYIPLDKLIRIILQYSGLLTIGRRNFLDIRIVRNEIRIQGLPAAFDGFRLLQISDLHCDLNTALTDVVLNRLQGLEYDAVALTGDYHNKISRPADVSLEEMGRIIPRLHQPRFAILGNHDFIEYVTYLEHAGLPVLLNESRCIERDGARIWICGVDDPHFFATHDLARARAAVPVAETAILLSHSPETYVEAERLGYALHLSGHTHGGQLCLPGGVPIIRNAPVPSRMIAGPWTYGKMRGYTSRGTGSCGVDARFFCPPEITVHVLRSFNS